MFAGYFKQKRYQDHFHSLPVIIDFSTGLPVDLCFPWKGRETKDPNLNSSSSGYALGCRLSRPVGGTDSGLLSGREETCTASRFFPVTQAVNAINTSTIQKETAPCADTMAPSVEEQRQGKSIKWNTSNMSFI